MVLGGAKALAWRGGGLCAGLLVLGDDSGDGMRMAAGGWGEKGIVREVCPSTSFFFVNLIFLIFLDFSYQHRLEWEKLLILKITR